MQQPEILAAGAVVSRKGPQVLLVHRPKYDDWSFPKGKLEPGEHVTSCAVREVAEETGLDVRLGPPLPCQEYLVRHGGLPRVKRVNYWAGRVVGPSDVSTYQPNAEIDRVQWCDLDRAERTLSHDHDRETLAAFTEVRKRSTPLVVLRHAKAESRQEWRGDDRERPLETRGLVQSQELVPVVAAYGVRRLLSSTSRRCWTTLAPYAHVTRRDLRTAKALSEEDADPAVVAEIVQDLLLDRRPAVLCTHRPVLPMVWDALGLPSTKLAPGGMRVVHHRRGAVVAVEQHAV